MANRIRESQEQRGGGNILTLKKFCNGKTGTKPNMEREHKEHREFYEDGCSICKLEQRFNKVLEMDEFKHFNPFREEDP